ncbi:MAG: MFS transporter [Rhodobacterales bacterium]|nr:MFS transporter [Rhodobacterales bacterium]NCT12822.1 MFS transporter [Rhodobacterales bacterium]
MPLALRLNPARRVFASFAIYAFAMGNIFPRLGDVQRQMGVGEGALGLGLIGAPVGTLFALTFAAPLLERLGHRRVLIWGIPLLAFLYAVAVQAPSPVWLFAMLLPVGLTIGCVEIIVNLEADRVEHQMGYRIMNRAHAFWSIGFFSAGLFGAAMAGLGLSPQVHLGLVLPLAGLGVWLLLGEFQPAAPRPTTSVEGPAPRFAAPTAAIMLLVAVTVSAMLMEGASMDWSAIYMRDVFGAGPFIAGVAVAAFAFSQALMRFYADGVVERFSPAHVARVLLAIMLAGCFVVTLSPLPWLSLIGFAMMGLGTSAIFPLAMSAAAQRQDRPAALNIAALAQISFMVFLLAPPLLGFVAEHYGIRTAFGIGLPLILLSLLTAGSLGRRTTAFA